MNESNHPGKKLTHQSKFLFACHSKVSCFTDCCNDVEMNLYPYDIIRLKNRLCIHSEQFLSQYTEMEFDDGAWFPRITLKMSENENHSCPFLSSEGCTVYEDRPFSCRSYPLARSISRKCSKDEQKAAYYLVRHKYCKGHDEPQERSVEEWVRSNDIAPYNEMNASWISVDTLIKSFPFQQNGMSMSFFRLLFSASYNLDNFRTLIEDHLADKLEISQKLLEKAKKCDITLMTIGFSFIRQCLTGEKMTILIS
ncbi:Fe-S oxidoreductase [Candidatus Magnetomorum sp. HK-1]|nr:Fe-S oxidoreductase [Candidatus Magnetomorum sp. HK-1]